MTPDPFDSLQELAARAPVPNSRVLEALRREVGAEREPKRSLSGPSRVLLSALVLTISVVVLTYKALPTNPVGVAIYALGLGLALTALVYLGALPHVGRWDRNGRSWLLASVGVVTLLTLGLEATHFSHFSHFVSSETAPAMSCAVHTFFKGTLCALALLFVWRKTDPFSPGLSGALLGLVGGLGGATSVGILCPSDEGFHLTLGHGLAALAIGFIGFFVGRKWLSP